MNLRHKSLLDWTLLLMSSVVLLWLVLPSNSAATFDLIGVLAACVVTIIWFVGWSL